MDPQRPGDVMAESDGARVARMSERHNLPARPRAALLRRRGGCQSRAAQAGSAATSAGFAARILDGLSPSLQSAWAWPGASPVALADYM